MNKKLCVIVDGYSTARQYAPLLNQKDYECLHIQSSTYLPSFITCEMNSDDYCDTYIHKECDINGTLQWIVSHGQPEFIIAGSDTATELCDRLSDALKLALRNPLISSNARRDKFEMGECIKRCGLKGIKQFKAQNLEQVKSWIRKEDIEFPIIVKPLKSGSGEGFRHCQNLGQIEAAFLELLGQNDLFNQINYDLLVQEYLEGDEYVINTVSCAGQHLVSEFGLYKKKINENGNSIYQSLQFLPRNFEKSAVLKKYAFSVLDALDIHYGPSHMEVMLTKKGPILIEVGARPMGNDLDRKIMQQGYGHTQIDLSISAYTSPGDWFSKEPILKDIEQHTQLVYLMPEETGKIIAIHMNNIENLSSFRKIDFVRKVGDRTRKAQHLDDLIGIAWLQNNNNTALKSDKMLLEKMLKIEYSVSQ